MMIRTPQPTPDLIEVSNFGGPPALLFLVIGGVLLAGVIALALANARRRR